MASQSKFHYIRYYAAYVSQLLADKYKEHGNIAGQSIMVGGGVYERYSRFIKGYHEAVRD